VPKVIKSISVEDNAHGEFGYTLCLDVGEFGDELFITRTHFHGNPNEISIHYKDVRLVAEAMMRVIDAYEEATYS
jgi:hypothetical protein